MKWIKRREKIKPKMADSPIEEIGKIRGLKGDDLDRFLNPTRDELHDPYLLKNVKKAGKRIIKAIEDNESVVVSVDGDPDGACSSATMIRYLKNYIDDVEYVYGERSSGHGIHQQTRLDFISDTDVDDNGEIISEHKQVRMDLNNENLDKISNADLLIIIDSSSNDVDACKKLVKDYGIDILIIDHHGITEDNPHALIVNPQLDDCDYPNKHLSATGVVLKVLQVTEDLLGKKGKVDPFQYIDLIAVGLYADVMPVDVLENRYIIMEGLRNMRNTGLIRILKGAKADLYRLNGDSIGFSIAPMINGVSRLDNFKLAIDILLEDDDKLCKPIRLKMQKLNEKRKEMQKELADRYSKNIDSSEKALIILDSESSRGFNGLIAQQLATQYKRPALVGRLYKGMASGSFRSYNGFKFRSFLEGFDGEIEAVGHEGAGGWSVEEEELPNLKEYIKRHLPSLEDTEPTALYDLKVNVEDIREYIRPLEQFNLVAGNGFPKVMVKVDNIAVEDSQCIGKTQETVKIGTFDDLELIKFKVNDEYASELGYFDTISAVGQLHMNEFYHFGLREKISTPQIILTDYKLIGEA